jgi:hypothetical protein
MRTHLQPFKFHSATWFLTIASLLGSLLFSLTIGDFIDPTTATAAAAPVSTTSTCTPQTSTGKGTVTVVGTDSFSLDSVDSTGQHYTRTFIVNSSTQFSYYNGQAATFANMKVGMTAGLAFQINCDNTNTAIKVYMTTPTTTCTPQNASAKGTVTAIGTDNFSFDSIDSSGQHHTITVKVTSSTTFATTSGQTVSFSNLQVGMSIYVYYQVNCDNTDTALRVYITTGTTCTPSTQTVRGSGSVTAIGADNFSFDSVDSAGQHHTITVKVTSSTTFATTNGQTATFASLKVGMSIYVYYQVNCDNTNTALRVYIIAATTCTPSTQTVRGSGTVTAIGADNFSFDSIDSSGQHHTITVKVTSSTSFASTNGQTVTFSSLKVGMNIYVYYQVNCDNTDTALRVYIVTATTCTSQNASAKGTVTAIGADNFSFDSVDSSGQHHTITVKVTSSTSFASTNGQTVTFSNLHVGMSIYAYYQVNCDNTDTALRVYITTGTTCTPSTQTVRGSGTVTAISADNFSFDSVDSSGQHHTITVKVTSSTSFASTNGQSASFASLKVGMSIYVYYQVNCDNTDTALRVYITTTTTTCTSEAIRSIGLITAVGADNFSFETIDSNGQHHTTTVKVTSVTSFVYINGQPASFASLKVGMAVGLSYQNCNGTYTALRVYLVSPPLCMHHTSSSIGTVTTIAADSFNVDAVSSQGEHYTITVKVTSATQFYAKDQHVSYSYLQTGMKVRVYTRKNCDGTYTVPYVIILS